MSRRTPGYLQRIPARERSAHDYVNAAEVSIGSDDPVKSLERALFWARDDQRRSPTATPDPLGVASQALRAAADALDAVAKEIF